MLEGIRALFVQFGELFHWWVIVAPWEQIVRVRLGKHLKMFGAGIHFTIPHVDSVYRQSIRRRICLTAMQTLTTSDGKTVTVSGQLGYAIVDVEKLYQTVHHAEDTLLATMQALVSEYIQQNDAADCTPPKVQEFVQESADLEIYGIGEVSFFVTNFAIVRTYRLLMDKAKDYADGDALNTYNAEKPNY